MKSAFILCQPDKKKACSICCGLFNFKDINRKHLSDFLEDGAKRKITGLNAKDPFWTDAESYIRGDVRDIDSHICPYQGFIAEGRPGCLLHAGFAGADERDASLFGSAVCSGFLCPAHNILSAYYAKLLIKCTDNWYLYSTGIADPDSFIWICNHIEKNYFSFSDNPKFFSRLLEKSLDIHAAYLCRNEHTVFCYSVPEYNIAKINFTIADNPDEIQKLKTIIKNLFSSW